MADFKSTADIIAEKQAREEEKRKAEEDRKRKQEEARQEIENSK